jgi:hypothetical protein
VTEVVPRVNLKDRMAGIDANLDDLQSGMEASSRAADSLHTDTTKFDGLLKDPLLNPSCGTCRNYAPAPVISERR